MFLFIEYVV
jgi:hypothetical protein